MSREIPRRPGTATEPVVRRRSRSLAILSAVASPLLIHCSSGGAGSTNPGNASSPTGAPTARSPGDAGATFPPPPAMTGPAAAAGPPDASPFSGANSPDAAADVTLPDAAAPSDAVVMSGPATGPFPSVADFTQNGPFTSMTVTNTGPNGNYTVYRPSELAPNGAKNPIVGWMSGGSTTPSEYTQLPRMATDGFVVVASNTTPQIGQEVELGQEILAGITWAISENARQGSDFYGKLDTTKVASMGYSMGSLATFTIASDPRLTTTVHISGGNMPANSDRIKNLHAPAAFICGYPSDAGCSDILSNTCDIAAPNCDTDFANAMTPLFYANFPGGHLGTLTPPQSDRNFGMALAWLRWKLMSDTTLESMFVGAKCSFCTNSEWVRVQQKNL
jgi:hypothetical protein